MASRGDVQGRPAVSAACQKLDAGGVANERMLWALSKFDCVTASYFPRPRLRSQTTMSMMTPLLTVAAHHDPCQVGRLSTREVSHQDGRNSRLQSAAPSRPSRYARGGGRSGVFPANRFPTVWKNPPENRNAGGREQKSDSPDRLALD
jgi:hypothetical protein